MLASKLLSQKSMASCSRAFCPRPGFRSHGGGAGGAGYGNVKDQLLPTEQETERELFQHCRYPRTTSVISAPMTYGQPFVGTDCGPQWLKENGLRSKLSSLGWRVKDGETIDFDNHLEVTRPPPGTHPGASARNSPIVGRGTYQLAEAVGAAIERGEFPLILGGDHSIAIGSLAAILKARPNVGVIWMDAHADLNTPSSSPSGNMHGMPVGLLMEGVSRLEDMPLGCEWLRDYPRLSPDSIVYVGLRDVDAEERRRIRNLGIKAFTMTDIDHYGIGTVMDRALQHLMKNDPNRPLHLSYDIDVIDPVYAPATGTTVRGGLTFREAHFVAEMMAASGNLASAEIVELNPNLSDGSGANATVDMGLQIITSFMGKSII